MTPPEIISSSQNQILKLIRKYLQNHNKAEFKNFYLIEGAKHVYDFMQSHSPEYLLASQDYKPESDIKDLQYMASPLWKELTAVPDIIGLFKIEKSLSLQDFNSNNILILDQIQDPGNLGTILRTALGAEWQEIVLIKGSCKINNPKVLRASASAIKGLKIIQDIDYSDIMLHLKKSGYQAILSSPRGETTIKEIGLKDKTALIIGNEGNGASPIWSEGEHLSVNIPISDELESLNASISAALLMYKLKDLI